VSNRNIAVMPITMTTTPVFLMTPDDSLTTSFTHPTRNAGPITPTRVTCVTGEHVEGVTVTQVATATSAATRHTLARAPRRGAAVVGVTSQRRR
jgi:hypothetical protein